MKQMVPALAPLLRSNTQGDLLAALLLDESREWSLADLQRQVKANASVVHREIDRLVSGGVAQDRRVGRTRLVRADPDYELWAPLAQIVLRTYGPKALLSRLLSQEPSIEAAYIYGSWAARYEGEIGLPPQDVDVLVVGDPDRTTLQMIESRAQESIRKEVNITRAQSGWQTAEDPFFATLRERPLVEIPLTASRGT